MLNKVHLAGPILQLSRNRVIRCVGLSIMYF